MKDKKKTEKKEETTEPTEEETTKDEEPTAPQVDETEPQGNGIRVEDLVTKEMLAERLSTLEAKFDAVVKENNDLKDKLSSKSEELDGMKDKYENKDFGNFFGHHLFFFRFHIICHFKKIMIILLSKGLHIFFVLFFLHFF